MNEKRYILEPVTLETRDINGEQADFITGNGVVFNKWSLPMRGKDNKGQEVTFIETIEPRAVEGVDLDNIVSMVDHKYTLGKRNKGTVNISVTNEGIRYEVKVPNTTIGQDARENIRNGNLEGSSFQFSLAKGGDIWDKTSTPFKRTITKFASIVEMGPVTYPAYPDTTAAMRSLDESEPETVETETNEEKEARELLQRLAKLQRKYNYTKTKY